MKLQEFNAKYEALPKEEVEENFYKDFPTNYNEWECYKSDKTFAEADLDDIIYVPELGYTDLPEITGYTFTKQDIITMCDNNVDLAEYIYEGLEWQCPSTYLEELLNCYLDVVIDYNADRIHDGNIHETLWNMLSQYEQEKVLIGCK